MKIRFNIHYRTDWGQRLFVCGSTASLGKWDPEKAAPMLSKDGHHWTLELSLTDKKATDLRYKFFVRDERNNSVDWEWGEGRELANLSGKFDEISVRDFWRSSWDLENAMFSAAFTQNLMRRPVRKSRKKALTKKRPVHRFQLNAARIEANQVFCVLGSDPALGKWDETKAVVLDDSEYPVWKTDIALRKPGGPVEYKYAIYDPEEKKVIAWEEGGNRRIEASDPHTTADLHILADEHFRYPGGFWRGAGVAIPVFSLRTAQGAGVGEFSDLKPMVDWAAKTGLKIVQILPINDTTATYEWTDSYPYSGISVFALHPIYVNIDRIGKLPGKEAQAQYEAERARLNALEVVDYEAVMKLKMKALRQLFDHQKTNFLKSESFKTFFDPNQEWLVPYAAFAYLRDEHGTPKYAEWKRHSEYQAGRIKRLSAPGSKAYNEIAFHYFIQYHLDKQLGEVAEYARNKGVVLKGDIPIGIFRHSVDAWVAPQLYHMDGQAGAPPDAYAEAGQNWEFPTYNWEVMAADGYQWWKKRLSHMAKYFDAYRIDHILGFFRIWQIPIQHVEGLLGYFNPALPLSREELQNRGVGFDYDRFCRPYIRSYMLDSYFGDYTGEAQENYLEEYQPGHFRLKAGFQTQREVEAHFRLEEEATEAQKTKAEFLKKALFGLIREVLFIEQPGSEGEAFHPRIALHFTHSYRDLDAGLRHKIDEIYIDFFYHRHNDFWRDSALEKLPAITSATNMLVCGEDLGMVPDSVPGVMRELGILSLEIQRMSGSGEAFSNPAAYPWLSVCSPSCHDMSTIRGWWEEDRDLTQRFYNQLLGHGGGAPYSCEPGTCQEIVMQHLYSPSMWAIFPIQDLLAMDEILRRKDFEAERINVPANPKHYWQYRFHLNLEALLNEESFNRMVLDLVRASGRKNP